MILSPKPKNSSGATITEQDGIWEVQVRRGQFLTDQFKTPCLFELIRWLRTQYPMVTMPHSFAGITH